MSVLFAHKIGYNVFEPSRLRLHNKKGFLPMPSKPSPTGENIRVGSMVNSAIQQGSPGAVQHIVISDQQREDAAGLVRAISELISQLDLTPDKREELETEADTLSMVLSSEYAKPSVLQRCFARVKEAIGNAAVSATNIAAGAASANVIARIENYLSQWSSQ